MSSARKIRVLVVDDSLLFREVFSRGISNDPDIEVVGTASDVYEATDKIIDLQPDVLTLDIEMPKMNGVEFLRQLIPQYPIPVVVVSSANKAIFDALDAGAVDFVDKPNSSRKDSMNSFINEMIVKIKIASTAKIGSLKSISGARPSYGSAGHSNETIIAIGASTGGTEATLEVIKNLPRDIPGIVIVQHMPPVFTKMYAERLNNICAFEVKEAENGDAIRQGRALIAPGGLQMRVVKDKYGYAVKIFEGERVNGHSPSVDVMFDSVAEVVRNKAIGVILTGMGSDGAKGLLKMRGNGAFTIGQDEKSCVVYGMPMVAYNIGAVAKQCPLGSIANEILKALRNV